MPIEILRDLREAFRITIRHDLDTRRAHFTARSKPGPSATHNGGYASQRVEICDVPLIQRLTNGQFVQITQKVTSGDAFEASTGALPRRGSEPRRCGCGQLVAQPRKFVDQGHYGKWLGERRYFGKNRPA